MSKTKTTKAKKTKVAKPAAKAVAAAATAVEQNGVKRQAAGSIGDKLWALFDNMGADADHKTAKEKAVAKGFNATSASIAFCNWRRFNGYTTKAAKPKKAAPVAKKAAVVIKSKEVQQQSA